MSNLNNQKKKLILIPSEDGVFVKNDITYHVYLISNEVVKPGDYYYSFEFENVVQNHFYEMNTTGMGTHQKVLKCSNPILKLPPIRMSEEIADILVKQIEEEIESNTF